jgi:hypothetical protein
MLAERSPAHLLIPLFCLLSGALTSLGQPAAHMPDSSSAAQQQALLKRVLATELQSAQDSAHPMRYLLHKTSPRLTSTKEICETRDGSVARLISINDRPLSPVDEQKEQARLDALLEDPELQRHRNKSEDTDMERALMILRALPTAFLYQYAGSADGPTGKVERFTFKPNPDFTPPNLETQVLIAMYGQIWIDAAHGHVVRLEGHLQRDEEVGWGFLGRLNKGGWIVIEQANVGAGQWRAVHFQMAITARVLFWTKVFDTTEEETRFAPVPAGLSYAQAIQKMRSGGSVPGGR